MCLALITLKRHTKTMQGSTTDIVPCGTCPQCLRRRQAGWAFRLTQQLKISTSAIFLTLTYENDPKSKNGLPTLQKSDYQDFTKRLRESLPDSDLKYYATGEYGAKRGRPHYHSILYNLPQHYVQNSVYLLERWGLGHISIDPVNGRTIGYVTNYVIQGRFRPESEHDDRQPHYSMMSKQLGLNYLTPQMIQYHKNNLDSSLNMSGGYKIAMPRYYRDKIFTSEEKLHINIAAAQAREFNFEKAFENNHKQKSIWTQDQYRKDKKKQRLERLQF